MKLGLYGKMLGAAAMFAVVAGLPAGGHAATTFDTTLDAGTVYGTGNPADHWTVDTETAGTGTVQLGLRAVYRFGNSIAPAAGTGDYVASTGYYPGSSTLALWNFTFSIDLQNSGYTLNQVAANIVVTPASTGVPSTPFDLLLIPDNDPSGSFTLAQNSENLGGQPGFDPLASDTYKFDLSLSLKDGGTVLATDSINVRTVPEPASMALLGAGLAGLGLIRRRRRA